MLLRGGTHAVWTILVFLGCHSPLGPTCDSRSRRSTFRVTFTTPESRAGGGTAAGSGEIELSELEGGQSRPPRVLVAVYVPSLKEPVISVHLHDGPPGPEHEIIFSFTGRSAPGVAWFAGSGTVSGQSSSDDVIDLMMAGKGFMDVHTETFASGEIHGPLRVTEIGEWQTFCSN